MSDKPKVDQDPPVGSSPQASRDRSAWPPSEAPSTPRPLNPPPLGHTSAEDAVRQVAPAPDFVPTGLPDFEEPSAEEDLLRGVGGHLPPRVSVPPTRHTLSLFDHEAIAPALFALMFLGTLLGLVYVMLPFIADVVLSFILVGLADRIYARLVKPLFGSRWLASAVTTLLVFILIILPFLGLGHLIVTEATNAYGLLSTELLDGGEEGAAQKVRAQLRSFGFRMSHGTALTYVHQLSVGLQALLVGWGAALLSSAIALAVHLSIIFVMVFYMLVDGPRLRAFLFELSPLPDDEDALIVDTFAKVSKGVVVGNGLGSMLSGLVGGVSMWAVGLPNPAVWGGVMALFSFLPFIGVSIVLIPAAILLYVRDQQLAALFLLVVCTVLTVFVEHVVKTKMIGSAMRMHDLLVLLSILGGIGAFGIVGIVYGPLIAMMFITFSDLYQSRYRPQLARRFAKRHD